MPTNANTFNSRVTSEALEKKFRDVFPAQGGAELVQDLFASGVIQPVVDFSSVAEGSALPTFLQTAWDFSTSQTTAANSIATVANNPGFWKVDWVVTFGNVASTDSAQVYITDSLTNKPIWKLSTTAATDLPSIVTTTETYYVFLDTGESLLASTSSANMEMEIWTRQVADLSGNLVNPLGFTFS